MKKTKYLTKSLLAVAVLAVALVVMLAFAHDEHHQTSATSDVKPATADAKVAINSAAYPLDYCIVSGEKLGEMGDPVVKTYNGREVKFCCNMCPPKFEKDKAKYTKKLDDAIIAAEKPNYPVETCVVSGEPLVHSEMGDPVDYVYQNRLVRFCCNHCVKTFNKSQEKFLAKLDAAAAAKSGEKAETPQEKQ